MMRSLHESDVETYVMELLEKQWYGCLSQAQQEEERESLADVVLRRRLRDAIDTLKDCVGVEYQKHGDTVGGKV